MKDSGFNKYASRIIASIITSSQLGSRQSAARSVSAIAGRLTRHQSSAEHMPCRTKTASRLISLLGTLVCVVYQLSASLQNAGRQVDHVDLDNDDSWLSIRQWGCDRNETPFVFVHIGKAGGGTVGMRIVGSSINATPGDNSLQLCRHCFTHRRPNDERRAFGGSLKCNASTPLGRAIACPEPTWIHRLSNEARQDQCNLEKDTCRIVYVGHNFLGSEMTWLPPAFLQKWWSQSPWSSHELSWDALNHGASWCPSHNVSRPREDQEYNALYQECSLPLQHQVDAMAKRVIYAHNASWSSIYASIPVLRVTVMRNPFDWLVSKFFWHTPATSRCDDVEYALSHQSMGKVDMANSSRGWITRMALGHIFYLCGEDCAVRYFSGESSLQDLEEQAKENLQQSFAVVGLLEDLPTFYKMLSARISYMNTSRNVRIEGPRHSSGSERENKRCKSLFQKQKFQRQLLSASPELSALVRLYNVAKQVNRFQAHELRQCASGTK